MLTGIPEVQAAPIDTSDYAKEPATVDVEAVSCLQ